MSENLLSTERNLGGFVRRKTKRLVVSIRMKALRSAQHSGKCLVSGAGNIIFRLRRLKAAPRGLDVKTHPPRFWIACFIMPSHLFSPNSTSGTVLGNFFKETLMGVKEEREARRKL